MFKVRALNRFMSSTEGMKKRGDTWTTTRDRAYELMSLGNVELIEGDATRSNFETHGAPALSSPAAPPLQQHFEARQVGQLGQPSPSTTGGVFTSTPPQSTPQTDGGGAIGTNPPASDTPTLPAASVAAPAAGPATRTQQKRTGSNSSKSNAAKGSAAKKEPSAPAE